MSRKLLLNCIFLLTFITSVQAQRKAGLTRTINWESPVTVKVTEDEFQKHLAFDGAKFNTADQLLPSWSEVFNLPAGSTDAVFTLSNLIFAPLTETGFIKDPSLIGNTIQIRSFFGHINKSPVSTVSFIPLRKNPSTGSIEKLISFDIIVNPVTGAMKNPVLRYYGPSSVLASGTWYKIKLNKDGVYKLSKSFLTEIGINTSGLSPHNVRVFGNGGGMVPRLNSIARKDDLTENPVSVNDENNNGIFDDEDYVLFYGQGPDRWNYASDSHYHHTRHLFSDFTYYFITTDQGVSKSLTSIPSETGPATNQVTSFDDYLFHESDLVNFIKSGNKFFGESFDVILSQDFGGFNFPNMDHSLPVFVQTDVAAKSLVSSSFTLRYNGQTVSNFTVPVVSNCFTCAYAAGNSVGGTFNSSSDNITLNLQYNQPSASSIGWLNFIELNARRYLTMNSGQISFRDALSMGPGKIAQFTISNVSGNMQIWDVTDPTNAKSQQYNTISGGIISFLAHTDSLRQFVAFNTSSFLLPEADSKVANQNLHGLAETDMVILTHPDFINEARDLAQFHQTHDNLRVHLVTTAQVYNEYSSGNPDISAIRDFMKMFYDRAAVNSDLPRYLLLFGDGSYDNKKTGDGTTNFIPTFQTDQSFDLVASYVSDDYFGLLDDDEGRFGPTDVDYLDIGIGRFPVKNSSEARAMVNKVITYSTAPGTINEEGGCTSGKCNPMGDWRNTICFIGDDEDGGVHLMDADKLANYMDTTYNNFNIDKIYLDAYPEIATPGGQRYPAVNDLFNRRVEKGALMINYTGHGGEVGLAHERILEIDDINSWENGCRMPVFLTATCEFSRFDDPERTSAGELVLLNEHGGGIALFTTVRLSYSNSNYDINFDMYRHIYDSVNGGLPRIGDIFKLSKRENAATENTRNYSLLGDPAVMLAYPSYQVQTSTFNGNPVSATADTIRALGKVTVTGFIKDNNGNKVTGFNGIIYPSVYDKAANIRTLANDPASPPINFKLQKNILYKGKVSVVNGEFTFSFIVPKDIAYQYGKGRISYYAQNGQLDASGNYENFIIGGTSADGLNDAQGPQLRLYINDEKFVSGSITDESPKLYAVITDSSGVNTIGNGIGHDITAQLDNRTDQVFVLNDYYEAELNSYQKGKVVYELEKLSEGHHSVKLKVWDINNNSSETSIDFVVESSAGLALSHVLNYPNPFTTQTTFFFEHNKACVDLQVQIQIYTVTGKLIKTINEDVQCEGYLSNKIKWDGRDDYGDAIGRGVYIYNLKVKAGDGTSAHKIEKLVVLK
jgi:hypothetical protein